jgi:hypothetical protein
LKKEIKKGKYSQVKKEVKKTETERQTEGRNIKAYFSL